MQVLEHKVSRKGKKLVLTGKGRDHEGVKGLIRMETQTQSADAAKSSGELIVQAINAVEEGKGMVDDAAVKLMESVEKTKELVENIEQISVASEQQAESLKQVSEAASQIAAVVEENTAMAEESSASSEELASQADRLKESILTKQL